MANITSTRWKLGHRGKRTHPRVCGRSWRRTTGSRSRRSTRSPRQSRPASPSRPWRVVNVQMENFTTRESLPRRGGSRALLLLLLLAATGTTITRTSAALNAHTYGGDAGR